MEEKYVETPEENQFLVAVEDESKFEFSSKFNLEDVDETVQILNSKDHVEACC